jgi:hypothetical protein
MILLIIAAIFVATGSRNKTYLGNQALSTYCEGASRPPTRRQIRLARSSNFLFLVQLYRRLWESCMSKHMDGQKLQQSNQILQEAGAHLRKKRDHLQVRHDKQLSRLRFFEQALELSRKRLVSVLDDCPFILNLAGSL